MKQILYFMPKMSLKNNAGNVTRVISLLQYFKSREFHVDFFGIKNWNIKWEDDLPQKMLDTKLVDRVFWEELKPPKTNFIKRLFTYKIPEYIKRRYYGGSPIFRSFCTFYLRKTFEKVLQENRYDYIVINYVLWVNLIKYSKNLKGAKVIVDTHDFLTIHAARDPKKKKHIGKYFQTEMENLSFFDEVWAVSIDEMYIFTQFLHNTKVRLVPNMPLFVLNKDGEYNGKEKEYDIIYVASENPWNQMSSKWFFADIYPLLPQNLKICVVGKINEYIKEDYPNVEKIHFAKDLGEMYAKSRIAICPMLEGTGIKLKVLEALSFGLPVVCTQRGIDGLPNKLNNGCLLSNTAEEFAGNIMKLISDSRLYEEQSKLGYDLFKIYFNPEVRYKQLDEIFDVKED
ncbi:glycosyltransferase family 4 protein [Dysgonomonas sp. 511]|uniref:glycosyltransferase family 4 protein n=1 Tax=Dysgonomonas sp. 511 TaxID=2302930 RepID=UPI0013D5A7EE|nr:glycosyltransferase family 4 protein [Dysgonomonas sp. 511]NDV78522.1 glycosyltransferase [Dysgonomonas sp. 511]